MISLLLGVLVVCVVIWAAQRLMVAFGIGEPIRTVVLVVVVILALLWFMGRAGLVPIGWLVS